jgi:hypothetical protein
MNGATHPRKQPGDDDGSDVRGVSHKMSVHKFCCHAFLDVCGRRPARSGNDNIGFCAAAPRICLRADMRLTFVKEPRA